MIYSDLHDEPILSLPVYSSIMLLSSVFLFVKAYIIQVT